MAEYIKGVYHRMNKVAFFVLMGVSVFLIITAFFIPPMSVIDASVLTACGELAGWGALMVVWSAIERGSDVKFTKGDTTVHIDNPPKDGNE